MCIDRGFHEEIYEGHLVHIEWDHSEWDTHKDVRPCTWIVYRIERQGADMPTLMQVANSERVDLFHLSRFEAMHTVRKLVSGTVTA